MITAFLLTIYLGAQVSSANTYFYDIDRCNYFAKRINQQPAIPKGKGSVKQKAVCTLRRVNPNEVLMHR